jgi:murein DD-endopeptidase MepM/ murein hydrolase activator NlpD
VSQAPSIMRILLMLLIISTVIMAPAADRGNQIYAAEPIRQSPRAPTPWHLPIPDSSPREISRGFEPPGDAAHDFNGHRGVDFPASPGTAIHAMGSGVVYFVGVIAGKPTVSINHGVHPQFSSLPIRSTYEPVSSHLSQGEYVYAGQKIGVTTLGNSHCRAMCVHVGLKIDKHRYINPLRLWTYWSSLLSSARG